MLSGQCAALAKDAALSTTKPGLWLVILCIALSFDRVARAADGDDWKVVVHPSNSFAFNLLSSDKSVLQIGAACWGPGWSWIGISSDTKATGDQLRISAPMEIGGQKPTISLDVKSEGPRKAVFDYTLNADKDLPILQIIASVGVPAGRKGKAELTRVDGSEKTTDLPMNPAEFGVVKKIALTGPAWTGAV